MAYFKFQTEKQTKNLHRNKTNKQTKNKNKSRTSEASMGGTKDSAANPKTGLKWEFIVINHCIIASYSMIIENRALWLARSFALYRYNHRAVIITLKAISFQNGARYFDVSESEIYQ